MPVYFNHLLRLWEVEVNQIKPELALLFEGFLQVRTVAALGEGRTRGQVRATVLLASCVLEVVVYLKRLRRKGPAEVE